MRVNAAVFYISKPHSVPLRAIGFDTFSTAHEAGHLDRRGLPAVEEICSSLIVS
jgi:hypothetical protein